MVDEGFDLKWKNYLPEVFGVLRHLRTKEAFSDVLLYCDGEQFPAHKVILAACSTFFERMFTGVPSNKAKLLVLAETRPDMLHLVLDFIYNGEVFVETSVLQAFMETAERLEIRGLRKSDDSIVPAPDSIPLQLPTPPAPPLPPPAVLPPALNEFPVIRSPVVSPPARIVNNNNNNERVVNNRKRAKPVMTIQRSAPLAAPVAASASSVSGDSDEDGASDQVSTHSGGGMRNNGLPPAKKKAKTSIGIAGVPGGRRVFTGLPPGISIEPSGTSERERKPEMKAGAIRVTALPRKTDQAAPPGPSGVIDHSQQVTHEIEDDEEEDDEDVVELQDGGSVKTEYVDAEDQGDYSNDGAEMADDGSCDDEGAEGEGEQYQYDGGVNADGEERPQNIPPEISTSDPVTLWKPDVRIWIGKDAAVRSLSRYLCGLCGYSSTHSSHVTRHSMIHTGRKPYGCPVCKWTFTQRSNLKVHLFSKHGITM